uniref:Phosphate transporter n=1 Tax=Mycena chlorophos TaxID=658473 RepID=A0ABQ0KZ57_MYCCL|nr:phosphate transporter [Mycena chlorophos]
MVKDADIRFTLNEHRRAALLVAEIENAKFSSPSSQVLVSSRMHTTYSPSTLPRRCSVMSTGTVQRRPQANSPRTTISTSRSQPPVDTLFEQLFFGWLADVVGRKRMYGVELVIITVCTFAQAIAGGAHAISIIGALLALRSRPSSLPLASVAGSSRPSSLRKDGAVLPQHSSRSSSWSHSRTKILAEPALDQLNHIDYMWRILIGFDCIPAAIALYFRLTIPETPRFTMDIERNVVRATDDIGNALAGNEFNHDPDALVQRIEAPRASWADFCAYFGKWEDGRVLLGTALDTAFYGLGLNSLYNVAIGNLILAAAGLIPDYYACFFLIDSWGRRPIQLMGFIVLTALFAIMGFGYDKLVQTTAGKDLFVFLYFLRNFFSGFGPNTTTSVAPGKVFPTRYRSTAHGISAASGKLGAIIAQVGFSRLANIGGPNAFVKHLLEIFAFFMLIGVFSTLLLPETKQRTLEELSNEKQEDIVRAGVQARHIELKDFGDLRH